MQNSLVLLSSLLALSIAPVFADNNPFDAVYEKVLKSEEEQSIRRSQVQPAADVPISQATITKNEIDQKASELDAAQERETRRNLSKMRRAERWRNFGAVLSKSSAAFGSAAQSYGQSMQRQSLYTPIYVPPPVQLYNPVLPQMHSYSVTRIGNSYNVNQLY